MPVSQTFYRLTEEALRPHVPGLRFRKMFGGMGIYSGSLIFALLAHDQLFFKVGDTNRADFEAIGSGPFRPFGESGPSMSYYEIPLELLETPGRLESWVAGSLHAALTANQSKPIRRKRKPAQAPKKQPAQKAPTAKKLPRKKAASKPKKRSS